MAISIKPLAVVFCLLYSSIFYFLLRVKPALATAWHFKNLSPRAFCLFDMKKGPSLSIRKARDPGNKIAKYKQIDRTYVDGIVE